MIEKIVSGGQTGVDSAALDAAIHADVTYGGWCPQGRINENGTINKKYSALKEISGPFKSEKENYDTRTKYNIRDADGTLIFVPKIPLPPEIKDGTLLTIDEVQKWKKPYLIIDLSKPELENAETIIKWVKEGEIKIINIAGPRESSSPGIYQLTLNFLNDVLPHLKNNYSLKSKL